MYVAETDTHRRCKYLIRSEFIYQHAGGRNVSQRIHRSDFMEMYLLHRHSVCRAFSLGDERLPGDDLSGEAEAQGVLRADALCRQR